LQIKGYFDQDYMLNTQPCEENVQSKYAKHKPKQKKLQARSVIASEKKLETWDVSRSFIEVGKVCFGLVLFACLWLSECVVFVAE